MYIFLLLYVDGYRRIFCSVTLKEFKKWKGSTAEEDLVEARLTAVMGVTRALCCGRAAGVNAEAEPTRRRTRRYPCFVSKEKECVTCTIITISK
jgi:hypothetical protein